MADGREQAAPDVERLVVPPDDLRAARAGLPEHRRFVDAGEPAVAKRELSAHEHRPDGHGRRAECELAERVVQWRERERVEVEEHEVGAPPGLDPAETVRVARGGCSALRRHVPRLVRPEPFLVVDVPDLVQERGQLHRRVHVVAVVRAHAVGAERDVHPGAQELRDRADAGAELQVRDRVVHDRDATAADDLHVRRRHPDAVLEGDARREEADLVEMLGKRAAVHAPARQRLHARLEDMDVDHQIELVGERGGAGEKLVGAALRPGRRRADRDALVRTVEAFHRQAHERLPLRPLGRLVALEARDERRIDERLVEHDRLVVGAIGDREPDQRSKPEIAVGANDRVQQLFGEPLELVQEVDDARRARAEHLDAADEGADVHLVRRLRRCREHRIREEHPRLEREAVPHAAEPVLIRVAVGVDRAGHDGEPGAVDDLVALEVLAHADDAAAGHSDVGAGEASRADVDQSVAENELRRH